MLVHTPARQRRAAHALATEAATARSRAEDAIKRWGGRGDVSEWRLAALGIGRLAFTSCLDLLKKGGMRVHAMGKWFTVVQ